MLRGVPNIGKISARALRFLYSVVEEMDRHPARVVSFEDLLGVLDRAVPTFDENEAIASARGSARGASDLVEIAEAKGAESDGGGNYSPGAKGGAKGERGGPWVDEAKGADEAEDAEEADHSAEAK